MSYLVLVTVFISSVFSKEYIRKQNIQCQTKHKLDNERFLGSLTLNDCIKKCINSKESQSNKNCLAIEWSDYGQELHLFTKHNCALVYECDYTQYWNDGSTYILNNNKLDIQISDDIRRNLLGRPTRRPTRKPRPFFADNLEDNFDDARPRPGVRPRPRPRGGRPTRRPTRKPRFYAENLDDNFDDARPRPRRPRPPRPRPGRPTRRPTRKPRQFGANDMNNILDNNHNANNDNMNIEPDGNGYVKINYVTLSIMIFIIGCLAGIFAIKGLSWIFRVTKNMNRTQKYSKVSINTSGSDDPDLSDNIAPSSEDEMIANF